jgi:hypothetical protein
MAKSTDLGMLKGKVSKNDKGYLIIKGEDFNEYNISRANQPLWEGKVDQIVEFHGTQGEDGKRWANPKKEPSDKGATKSGANSAQMDELIEVLKGIGTVLKDIRDKMK